MQEERAGYIVRVAGRRITFSKKTDAAALFRYLLLLGVPYRQGEETIGALLGVDARELSRGIASPIETAGGEHVANDAVFAIRKHINIIRARLTDQDVNAEAAVSLLPSRAQSWLREVIHNISPVTR